MSLNRVGGSILIPSVSTNPTHDHNLTNRDQPGQQFLTGVVREFFSDPQTLSDYDKEVLRKVVKTSTIVDRMPINSIHCIVIDDGRRDEHIAYPFFSQHLCVPVKPGEHVWLIKEGNLYYWFCRKTGDYTADDLNYTHIDRVANFDANQPSASQVFSGNSQLQPQFPNGTSDSETDSTLGVNLNYENIIKSSQSYNTQFTPGSVPRLTRKPGDLVLQGSNNTAIVLGDQQGQGEIRMTAGRRISSDVVVNARGYEEINKQNPASSDGPLDSSLDSSSISISMFGNIDNQYGISIDGTNGSGSSSGIAIKSDQVRLIARQDIKITVENSRAGIVIKQNGEIVIIPSPDSVVKIGGDDANKAILCQDIIPGSGEIGNVQAISPVVSTMGGVIGSAAIPGTGFFASKVLVK